MAIVVLWLVAAPIAGQITAEHPSDYVRMLEAESPRRWNEAVARLLGEKNELPIHAVSSVLRRLPSLDAAIQLRVVEALAADPRHRDTLSALSSLSARASDGRVRAAAGAVRDTLRRRAARTQEPSATTDDDAGSADEAAAWQGPVRTAVLVLSAVVAGVTGLLLFVWAFRLLALASRIRNRPISKAAAVALGPVALQGEIQPAGGGYLAHPVTGESCLYYAGADRDHPATRLYLIDESGRILVDPRRAVLFSDDGVLVPGERVHVVGHAVRDEASGRPIVGRAEIRPTVLGRIVHRSLSVLFGSGRSSTVTRMLFADPGRCFWIWDDLERRPMGELRDYAWLVAGVLLGGAWMVLFALAILGLVDQEATPALEGALEALVSSSS
jgi:hypothetical protein